MKTKRTGDIMSNTINAPFLGQTLPIVQNKPYIPLKALNKLLGIPHSTQLKKLPKLPYMAVQMLVVNGRKTACIGILWLYNYFQLANVFDRTVSRLGADGTGGLLEFYIDYNKLSLWK